MSQRITLKISRDGKIRGIYSDALANLMKHGKSTVTRVSHVEPSGSGWAADMAPVGGPILGPFALRQEALDAEVDWLRANIFGVRV
jgi:hypothetical protein